MEIRFKSAVVEFVGIEHIATIPGSDDNSGSSTQTLLPDKGGDVRSVPFGMDHQPALRAIRPHDEGGARSLVRDTQHTLGQPAC